MFRKEEEAPSWAFLSTLSQGEREREREREKEREKHPLGFPNTLSEDRYLEQKKSTLLCFSKYTIADRERSTPWVFQLHYLKIGI